MADVLITCITLSHTNGRNEHITHVGNLSGSWRWPKKEVIESIDAKTNTFYVLDPVSGKRADVGVHRPTDGRAPFLQTYADGIWNNNLLSLAMCR
jgi:Protein of unknown function (DUF3892)